MQARVLDVGSDGCVLQSLNAISERESRKYCRAPRDSSGDHRSVLDDKEQDHNIICKFPQYFGQRFIVCYLCLLVTKCQPSPLHGRCQIWPGKYELRMDTLV